MDQAALPSASQMVDVALSPSGACGRFEAGKAVCWGHWAGAMPPPGAFAGLLSHVAEIRIGHDVLGGSQQSYSNHICAIVKDGVWCFGNGDDGQLGLSAVAGKSSLAPVSVPGLPPVRQLALGAWHSCALTVAGEVWCWGRNKEGQAGAGPETRAVAEPRRVVGLESITQIAVTNWSSCALTAARDVYCWGRNAGLEAGDGDAKRRLKLWSPSRVAMASGSRQIAGGHVTLCAVKGDGSIACWGYVSDMLGAAFNKAGAGDVPGIVDARTVAVGVSHACALRSDRSVWCWGKNDVGQLGRHRASASTRPAAVSLPGPASAVVAATSSTCARLEDRRWFCWGDNRSGQIGPRKQSVIARPTELDLARVELNSVGRFTPDPAR